MEPQTPEVARALAQCERLELSIRQFHAKDSACRLYAAANGVKPRYEFYRPCHVATRELKAALDAAGVSTLMDRNATPPPAARLGRSDTHGRSEARLTAGAICARARSGPCRAGAICAVGAKAGFGWHTALLADHCDHGVRGGALCRLSDDAGVARQRGTTDVDLLFHRQCRAIAPDALSDLCTGLFDRRGVRRRQCARVCRSPNLDGLGDRCRHHHGEFVRALHRKVFVALQGDEPSTDSCGG